MKIFVLIAFAASGIINLLPLLGILGGDWLARLYARDFAEPNLLVLMRHRALLFGLVGGFLLAAIVVPQWRVPAGVIGLISMAGFIAIAAQHTPLNAALKRVLVMDWIALALLVPALVAVIINAELRQ